jgi:hypothetical protein
LTERLNLLERETVKVFMKKLRHTVREEVAHETSEEEFMEELKIEEVE